MFHSSKQSDNLQEGKAIGLSFPFLLVSFVAGYTAGRGDCCPTCT